MSERDEAAIAPCPQFQLAARLKKAHAHRAHAYTAYIHVSHTDNRQTP